MAGFGVVTEGRRQDLSSGLLLRTLFDRSQAARITSAMDLGLREIGALANGLLSQQHGDGQPFHDLRHRWKPFFVIDSDAKDETWVY